MNIRHPSMEECRAVASLVQCIVDEVYGGLWTGPPVSIGTTDWAPAWIAVDESGLAGVGLTSGSRVEDLWVAQESRGNGVGLALLKHCEAEIQARGMDRASLRVVRSNTNAIRFYKARGWVPKREYEHERLPVMMVEMEKSLQT